VSAAVRPGVAGRCRVVRMPACPALDRFQATWARSRRRWPAGAVAHALAVCPGCAGTMPGS